MLLFLSFLSITITVYSYVYKQRKFEKATRRVLSSQPYEDARIWDDFRGQTNEHYRSVAPVLIERNTIAFASTGRS